MIVTFWLFIVISVRSRDPALIFYLSPLWTYSVAISRYYTTPFYGVLTFDDYSNLCLLVLVITLIS